MEWTSANKTGALPGNAHENRRQLCDEEVDNAVAFNDVPP